MEKEKAGNKNIISRNINYYLKKLEILKQDYKKIRAILDKGNYKKAKDYLVDNGFVKYREFGWIKEDRLQKAINLGLVKYSEYQSEFLLTEKGAKTNIFNYIGGGTNTIIISDSV